MRYRFYTPELESVPKIVVDGNESGRGFQLSHWPRNTTPHELKADLSVEIVLRLFTMPEPERYLSGYDLVVNDHFDTDGTLAAWAMLNPKEALQHRSALIAASQAGDFYEFTSPAAVQLELIVKAFEDKNRSPLASQLQGRPTGERFHMMTEAIFAELPGLLYDTGRYRHLWQERYAKIMERMRAVNQGQAVIREWPEERFSVIVAPFKLDYYTRNLFTKGDRILEAITEKEGIVYQLRYRDFLFFDIVSRAVSPKHLLTGLAERLNELEPATSQGGWGATKWLTALHFVTNSTRQSALTRHTDPLGHSALPVELVERMVREELHKLDQAQHQTAFV